LLPHGQNAINQDAKLQFSAGQPAMGLPIILPQVQDLLNFTTNHSAHSSSLSRHLWRAAQPSGKSIKHFSQFGVICKLAEGALCPIIQLINEDVKQD